MHTQKETEFAEKKEYVHGVNKGKTRKEKDFVSLDHENEN